RSPGAFRGVRIRLAGLRRLHAAAACPGASLGAGGLLSHQGRHTLSDELPTSHPNTLVSSREDERRAWILSVTVNRLPSRRSSCASMAPVSPRAGVPPPEVASTAGGWDRRSA